MTTTKPERMYPIATEVEECCYGFILHEPKRHEPEHTWKRQVQRPFRGNWLWLWGDAGAELLVLRCGTLDQLVQPMPFEWMQRDVTPEQFLKFVKDPKEELEAARVAPAICSSFGHAALVLAGVNVGAELQFRFRGPVRGIVLVGVQVP